VTAADNFMPARPKVYLLETSVVSYRTARRSRDIVIAGNQETTGAWGHRRHDFEVFVSQLLIEEASAGAPEAAAGRLAALAGLPLIEIGREVETVAGARLSSASVPAKTRLDPLHIAVATPGRMD
jgi:hypothetical protein